MDRRFLSDPGVVAASRAFVCVRLATYEDAAEARFLESIFRGRSGRLENTVFTILGPDGREMLVRAGRSPDHVFRGSDPVAEMARRMGDIARTHPGKDPGRRPIPYPADLRRGINLASCDIQPLVVVAGNDPKERERIEELLSPVAWGPEFVGRFAYAVAAGSEDWKRIGLEKGSGIAVVQPDAYGLSAKVLARDPAADVEGLKRCLKEGAAKFVAAEKDSMRHIEEGRRKGIHWETAVPVTDPGPPRR